MPYRFKKSESFYIRDGWFEKAIISVKEREQSDENPNVFYKNDGIEILGIGSNMVKGLKYWMQSAGIIDKRSANNKLTDFGELLYKYDRYMDDEFSWLLVHYFLVGCHDDCPVFHIVFTSPIKSFKKSDLIDMVAESVSSAGEGVKPKYIEDDVNVFLKSYVNDKPEVNPEDNFVCPLSYLGLLKQDGSEYLKAAPSLNVLDPLIVAYVLTRIYGGKPFVIEDSASEKLGPAMVFNLDKSTYLQYLDALRKNGIITINKAAGLNTVYFEKEVTLESIFESHFGGKSDV